MNINELTLPLKKCRRFDLSDKYAYSEEMKEKRTTQNAMCERYQSFQVCYTMRSPCLWQQNRLDLPNSMQKLTLAQNVPSGYANSSLLKTSAITLFLTAGPRRHQQHTS